MFSHPVPSSCKFMLNKMVHQRLCQVMIHDELVASNKAQSVDHLGPFWGWVSRLKNPKTVLLVLGSGKRDADWWKVG